MRHHTRAALLLSGLLAVACSGSPPAAHSLDGPSLSHETLLRIGSVDDSATALTWFYQLAVAPDGRIYTIHPQETTVRVHGPDGRPLGRVGRAGQGPGEYRTPAVLGIHGDSLWLLDTGNYRFNYYALDGTFLKDRFIDVDLGSSPGDNPPRPVGLLSDGAILGRPPTWARDVARGAITESFFVRFDATGLPADTFGRYSVRNTSLEINDPGNDTWGSYQNQRFTDTEIVRVSPFELAVFRVDRTVDESADPVVRTTKTDLHDDTIWSRVFSYRPVPIPAAQVDAFIRFIGESFSRRPVGVGFTAAQAEALARERLYVPAHHPTVSEMVMGSDGSLWFRREALDEDPVPWSVLDPAGEPVGTIRLPRGFRGVAADARSIWGLELDALDVPYIVRYGRGAGDGRGGGGV